MWRIWISLLKLWMQIDLRDHNIMLLIRLVIYSLLISSIAPILTIDQSQLAHGRRMIHVHWIISWELRSLILYYWLLGARITKLGFNTNNERLLLLLYLRGCEIFHLIWYSWINSSRIYVLLNRILSILFSIIQTSTLPFSGTVESSVSLLDIISTTNPLTCT